MSTDDARAPDLVLSYVDTIPDDVMRPFADAVSVPPAVVRIDRRQPPGPIAALEWLLPTAAFLYVAKSYFDGFLKEAGKEHYHLLKKQLSSLWAAFFGETRAIRSRVVSSTPLKIAQEPKYSRTFSLMAEGRDGLKIKLLLADNATPGELDAGVERFFQFLADYHRGVVADDIGQELKVARPVGRLLLVAYEARSSNVHVVDPTNRAPGSDDGA